MFSTQYFLDTIMPINDTIGSLVKASRKGDLERIEQLLDCGINVNASNKRNKYPLIEALDSGHLEAVKMLLGAGANANSALWSASEKDDRETVEILLEAGGDANMNENGLTPLLRAVCYRNLEVVELLLDHGADVNAELNGSAHGNALSAAMDPESIDIAKLLLKRGADVHAESTCYGSVLQTAIYRDNIKMVITLLSEKGVDVNAKAGPMGNALDVAYKQKNNEIIKILSNHGAKSTSMLLEESLDKITSNEETTEGFLGKEILLKLLCQILNIVTKMP